MSAPRCPRSPAVCRALLLLVSLAACAAPARYQPRSVSARVYVHERGGFDGKALALLSWRSRVCAREELTPEHALLDAGALLRFLARRGIGADVERPRADLAYVTLRDASGARGPRLRVAVAKSADEAARELGAAIRQHGSGSWGVQRSNLAVLGPVERPERAVRWLGETKLACWGVAMLGGSRDVYVIPGGYREL